LRDNKCWYGENPYAIIEKKPKMGLFEPFWKGLFLEVFLRNLNFSKQTFSRITPPKEQLSNLHTVENIDGSRTGKVAMYTDHTK